MVCAGSIKNSRFQSIQDGNLVGVWLNFLNLNTTFKFRLPETFSRYQPRPQPVS